MFIFGIVIVGLIVFIIFHNGHRKINFHGRKTPEDTLRERFARGEIDEKTFMKMKETLES